MGVAGFLRAQLFSNHGFLTVALISVAALPSPPQKESGYSACVVVVVYVVRNKVRQSYISRTVRPRIIKFCANLCTRLVHNHTGYDVTMYFRSEVIEHRKTADNGSELRHTEWQPQKSEFS